jgi:hypothetical protein
LGRFKGSALATPLQTAKTILQLWDYESFSFLVKSLVDFIIEEIYTSTCPSHATLEGDIEVAIKEKAGEY